MSRDHTYQLKDLIELGNPEYKNDDAGFSTHALEQFVVFFCMFLALVRDNNVLVLNPAPTKLEQIVNNNNNTAKFTSRLDNYCFPLNPIFNNSLWVKCGDAFFLNHSWSHEQ